MQELDRDLEAMGKLVTNPKTDLLAPIPHGSGQTILREVLLIADHNAYHLGQLVSSAGCWVAGRKTEPHFAPAHSTRHL